MQTKPLANETSLLKPQNITLSLRGLQSVRHAMFNHSLGYRGTGLVYQKRPREEWGDPSRGKK